MSGILSLVPNITDVAWEMKIREEDMKQRALENERRAIDDTRRAVDEKAQQLKTLAHQSALIAGFSMILIVEIEIPQDLPSAFLIAFGCTTATVVSLMLLSMLNATFMLVAILRYDTVKREMPFSKFWRTHCESDWKFALKSFVQGVPLFCLVLAQIGWVKLWQADMDTSRYAASSCISIIALSTIMIFLSHTERKWREWLTMTDTTIYNPEA